MSKTSLYKLGLAAAILSAVSWIVFILGNLSLPALSEISDPLQYFQTLHDTRTDFYMYGWGGIFGTLLSIPYIIVFYDAMKDRAPIILPAMIIALIGVVMASFGFFSPLTSVYFFVPLGLLANLDLLPFIKVAAEVAVEVFEMPWALGSFLVFGLGYGLIAYYGWRTSTGPKWVNVFGLLGGLTGIVWLVPFLPFLEPISVILRISNILLIFVWSIGLSIDLVRRKEPA